jgi:(2Fe-2S) ferredoxin
MCIKNSQQFKKVQQEYQARDKKFPKKVLICCGTGCLANGAQAIVDEFQAALDKKPVKDFSIEAVRSTGCHGFCEQGPLVIIEPEGIFYTKVKPKQVAEIIETTIVGGQVIEKLLYTNPVDDRKITKYPDVAFFAHQQRIALRNLGKIAPHDINDYIAHGGYQALDKVLHKMKPQEVIDEIKKSGLRGRGGGGFPTGRKWQTCADVASDVRNVICNGDEGDPGAFMDRSIMEGDPHAVLEGMIIAAYAVGAPQGYIYVREEYPLAVVHMQKAIDDCRKTGLLGEGIFGTDFSFDIRIARGAGAFVCGESSALMKSVAGEVGEPRAKYIRSVVKGLYDQPTVLNNVETYANVPIIIEKGAD